MSNELFIKIGSSPKNSSNKISIVGVGQVGMACAITLIAQNVTNDIALVDMDANKLEGEMLDFQHGSTFFPNAKACVKASTDYSVTAGSKLCIVTAGVRQKEGESRLDLVQRNVDVFKQIIPNLLKYSPNTILLIVSNPVDLITYAAWKISKLPKERVIGSGTVLDSSRFRYFLSQKLNVSPSSCHGFIIGEHGDSSVPVWSGVNVAGVPLHCLNKDVGTEKDESNMKQIHKDVVESAYKIIKLKGYTSTAIGFTINHLVKQILGNKQTVKSISTMVKGVHGIEEEVFLSLPSVLGSEGVQSIIVQNLSDSEKAALQKSAKALYEIQKDIKF